MSNKIIIGTRGSILALAQAEKVRELLLGKNSGLEVELKIIITSGDRNMKDFQKIKGIAQKDMFVKEIEHAMLRREIDIAVHSLKDMPQQPPEGLLNACFPIREDSRDVMVSTSGKRLEELPENAVIGTGSERRRYEILNIRNDVVIKPIRGNIHTRLKKLESGEYDAVILAAAGLKRTGMEERITEYFPEEKVMPAPGQGILCVQCREEDIIIRGLLESINDRDVTTMCLAEREFSRIFDAGCHTPVGCSSRIEGEEIIIRGVAYNGKRRIFKELRGNRERSSELAAELAECMKQEKEKI